MEKTLLKQTIMQSLSLLFGIMMLFALGCEELGLTSGSEDSSSSSSGTKAANENSQNTSDTQTPTQNNTTNDSKPAANVLVSIKVTPVDPNIAQGTTLQFKAAGIFDDGTQEDLTASVTWTSSDTNIATIEIPEGGTGVKGLATSVHTGTSIITATKAKISGSVTLTVTAATLQSIEIEPSEPTIAQKLTQQFKATGTYSDGSQQDLTQSVTWESSNTNVAQFSGQAQEKGLVSTTKTGVLTISAKMDKISASTLLTVVDVVLTSITITPSSASLPKDTIHSFIATGLYNDNSEEDVTESVNWSSSDKAVLTISDTKGDKGTATLHKAGATIITATKCSFLGCVFGGKSTIKVTATVTVTNATLASISIDPPSLALAKNTNKNLTATGIYSDGTTQDITKSVTWSCSDPKIASIISSGNKVGQVTGTLEGSCVITASKGEVESTAELTVTGATLVSIAITPEKSNLVQETSLQLTATGTYTDDTKQNITKQVSWTSLDTSLATINNEDEGKGIVKGLKAGDVSITASLGDMSQTAQLKVTDASPLSSIAILPGNSSVPKGATKQFQAVGTFEDKSTQDITTLVHWASTAPAVATVETAQGTKGWVTSLEKGTTTITATLGALIQSTTLTVNDIELTSMEVRSQNATLAKGTQQWFKATGLYSDHSTRDLSESVTWSSSDKKIASVDTKEEKGLVKALKAGEVTLSAKECSAYLFQFCVWPGKHSTSRTIMVSDATLESLSVTPTNPKIAKGNSVPLTATGVFSDESNQDMTPFVEWSSAEKTIATLSTDSPGLVETTDQTGEVMIIATDVKTQISETTTLTVTDAELSSVAIFPATLTLPVGLKSQLTLKGIYSDDSTVDLTHTASWSSSDISVATVSNGESEKGEIKAMGPGTATLSVLTKEGTALNMQLTVITSKLLSITVTPPSPNIAKGLNQAFKASGTYEDGNKYEITPYVTWSSTDQSIATIENSAENQGVALTVEVGKTTITATKKEGENDIKGSAELTVSGAVLTSIRIEPANPGVAVGGSEEEATVQLKALGVYTDQEIDLTKVVTWKTADAIIAKVSASKDTAGKVTGLAKGQVLITATRVTLQEFAKGSINLTVTEISQNDSDPSSDSALP
ncbi:Ig-like domain-containing protein [Deltaproteobacteria bacterium TL4]